MTRALKAWPILSSAFAFIILLAASPALAQTLDDLKRELAVREAEVQALRARIRTLEQQPVPLEPIPAALAQPAQPDGTPAEEPGGPEDINRALERALVRQGGLLLLPGTFEAELNFSYSHLKRDSFSFRRDAFGPGLALRVGLPFDSQFSAAIPYVFENRESPAGSNSGDGIGDLFLGLSHQLAMEGTWWPNLIAAVGYRLALGENTIFTSAPPLALGSGFNALSASLTATKRSDPLVLFGSYAFSHNFPDEKGTDEIDLGESHGIRNGALHAT